MFAVLSFWSAMTPDASLRPIYSPKSKSRPGLKITILWFDLIRWPGPLVPRELFFISGLFYIDFVTTYKVGPDFVSWDPDLESRDFEINGINGPP